MIVHDDNNSSQYDTLCLNQILRDFKQQGFAYIMTDNKLHAFEKIVRDFRVETIFDYFTQCTYYMVERLRKWEILNLEYGII